MTKSRIFQLIDLDRTLFDTSKFAKAITDEVNKTDPGLGTELDRQFEEAYKKEETFFLLRHLRELKGDNWFESLVDSVVEKVDPSTFLLPGVGERLAFAETLSDVTPAWGILTFGDEVDQRMKLRIAGLEDAPVFITLTPNKAEVIRSWRTESGAFQLPDCFGGEVVDMVTLEDDKLRAFYNLPAATLGLWVMTPGKKIDELQPTAVENVVPVQNLFDSIRYLEDQFLKS